MLAKYFHQIVFCLTYGALSAPPMHLEHLHASGYTLQTPVCAQGEWGMRVWNSLSIAAHFRSSLFSTGQYVQLYNWPQLATAICSGIIYIKAPHVDTMFLHVCIFRQCHR